ncbi:hypothetical protein AKJ39_02740 [candidate division MSBL1 archaeon SCGC-AAA259J03]|uniref:Uncharacterized protein n=1 Tax=candidate division MSBL1 archaeon SCGC-AAA259J03 TaxID=1698269 RepID=A0A656YW55_9EURY|nr:hypothetical protein AKJ39_02740 [candidate division MSBL1 archaeon SCGC-AAA259J03]
MTASPGSDLDRLAEVTLNLGVEKISIRTEDSEDVKPYVGEKDLDRVEVEKTDRISEEEKRLNRILEDFLGDLSRYSKKARGLDSERASSKVLKEAMGELQARPAVF